MVGILEIPAKLNKNTGKKIQSEIKKKVCGYVRVSTNLDEQKNSYRAQYDYYFNYINGNPDWEFIKLYADKGISGTNIINRHSFNEMIKDAKKGKIDMIITKSISRFARNTVDSLETIRELKDAGVDVFFERENFHTIDDESELLLSIISGISQEESHSISENTKWGIQKKYKGGISRRPYLKILGFKKDKNGDLIVNDSEIDTVKFIFNKYMEGFSTSAIAKQLKKLGYKNVKGECNWSASNIIKILKNEIYKGDSIMQKYFNKDFINKKKVLNTGERAKYEIINDHKGIIDKELFDCVQIEIKNREVGRRVSRKSILSSKLFCGVCKSPLRRKTWVKSNQKILVYLCTDRKKGICKLQYFSEEEAKIECTRAINYLLSIKGKALNECEKNFSMYDINCLLTKRSMYKDILSDLKLKINDIAEDIKDYKKTVDYSDIEQSADYIDRKRNECDKLKKLYDTKVNELTSLNDEIDEIKYMKMKNKIFKECLNHFNEQIDKYDEELCAKLIEKMYVYNDRIIVVYKNDMEVDFKR